MYVRRLKRVKDFRAFRNWTDTETKRPHSFGRQTVVLGANGSGKSTLADIAWAVRQSQLGDYRDPRLNGITFELTDGNTRKDCAADSTQMPRMLVFGKRYVETNLAQAFEEGSAGSALYVLGEKGVELEGKIGETSGKLDKARAKSEAATVKLETEGKACHGILENVKTAVAERLARFDPNRFNTNTFNVAKARDLLTIDGMALTEEALDDASADLRLTPDEIPKDLTFSRPTFPQQLRDLAEDTASHSVTSKAIEALASDGVMASWVERGIPIHGERTTCGFCLSPIPPDRIKDLEAHFSASHRQLIEKLDELTELLDKHEGHVEQWQAADAIIASESAKLGACVGSSLVKDYWERTARWLEAARDMVKRRRRNPHESVEWSSPAPPEDRAWDATAEAVRERNSELATRRSSINQTQAKAVSSILGHITSKHKVPYEGACSAVSSAEQAADAAQKLLRELETELKSLESRRASKHDGERLARALSSDLASYLGHPLLSVRFDKTSKRAGFLLLRDGKPAHDLSESERNAIALLHFLRSMEAVGVAESLSETCVVIDDPVSSLDHDAILAAFSFLIARLRESGGALVCEQVLILTHNFEFFRLWKDALSKPLSKDFGDAKKAAIAVGDLMLRRSSVLEMLTQTDFGSGTCHRQPRVRDFGTGLSALTSEYFYLFARACESTHPDGEDLLPLTGNSTRRLMEGFLKFKLPAETKFTQAAERLGSDADVEPEIVKRVVTALHGASHRTEIDIQSATFRAGVVHEIVAALRFMRNVDPDHYSGMCEATGHQANEPAA